MTRMQKLHYSVALFAFNIVIIALISELLKPAMNRYGINREITEYSGITLILCVAIYRIYQFLKYWNRDEDIIYLSNNTVSKCQKYGSAQSYIFYGHILAFIFITSIVITEIVHASYPISFFTGVSVVLLLLFYAIGLDKVRTCRKNRANN